LNTQRAFAHPLSDGVVESFSQDGFVATPDVFSAAELSMFASAVDDEVDVRTAHDSREVAQKSIYEQSFIQCMRLWETNAVVRDFVCDGRLASMAAQLLKVPSVRLWQDQALYKESGGRETTPHQDQTFWPIGDAPLVSVWIPFDAVTRDNGAMAYVPGSHLAGGLRPVDITHTTEPYDILNDPKLLEREPKWMEVEAGEMIWHHGFTIHQASANNTPNTRRVFTVVFIADGSVRQKSWPTFPLDRDQVEVGSPIAGEGMPMLWPKPELPPQVPEQKGVLVGVQSKVE
jgi:ectoine hydroxylase-related dioxygenase (phytanoyl-CoA dioxygenase family)